MATLIYEKKPLERPRDIRLVTLAPASASSDPICCTLQVVSLDAKSSISSYEALSYCWGSRFRTLPVTCDDETLFVTPNLLEALRRIRKQDEPRTLWVDVLCIDQSDLVELGIQVRQMRDIYAKARRVIVWLGEGHHLPSSDISFGKPLSLTSTRKLALIENACSWPGMMPNLKRNVQELAHVRKHIPGIRWPAANPDLSKLCNSLMKAREAAALLLSQTLQALLACDWFSRMWVLQESVVNDPVVMLAGDTITWVNLADTFRLIGKLRIHSLGEGSQEIRRLNEMNQIRYSINTNLGRDKSTKLYSSPSAFDKAFRVRALTQLLCLSQLFTCSDPRDKVYALLGLCRDDLSSQPTLLPDYNLPVTDVYRRFANYIIRKTGNLDILAVGTTRSLPGLPSWVPDWSVNTDEGRWGLGLASQNILKREKAGFEIESDRICFVAINNPQELGLKGCRLDIIKAVGKALTAQRGSESNSFEKDFAEIVENWEELACGAVVDGSESLPATKFMEVITNHSNLSKETDIVFKEWLARHTAMRRAPSNLSSSQGAAGDSPFLTNPPSTSSGESGPQPTEPNPASAATETYLWKDLALEMAGISDSWDQGLWQRFNRKDWTTFRPADKPVDVLLQCTQWVKTLCYGRSLYTTRDGRIGLAPPRARAGDVIIYFPGGSTPFVVRQLERCSGRFELVGDCTLSSPGYDQMLEAYWDVGLESIVLR